MRNLFFIPISAILLLFSACSSGGLKPSATGASNEILVVIDDSIENSTVGDSLFTLLDMNIPCMPQFEPYFNISKTDHKGFSGILKPARNIIIVNVSDIYSMVRLKHQQDAWSTPQSVMYINGPDINSVAEAIGKYGDDILNFFIKAERDRAIKFQRKSVETKAVNKVKEKFGFDMTIPSGMNRFKENEGALWIANSSQNISQNIVIYTFPYTDIKQFDKEYLLHVRDSVLKDLVPGPVEGSYMTTEYRYDPPRYSHTVMASGKFATETRGLWRVEGDMMGGPFVSVSTLDENTQRIVTAEAFLYAPNQYKRNALRQLEAVLFTMNFDNNTENDNGK